LIGVDQQVGDQLAIDSSQRKASRVNPSYGYVLSQAADYDLDEIFD